MVLTDHPICRFCECPAADGVVPVSRVDLQKLSEWCLTHLGEELDELDFDNDVFCHFCILDARFLADNDENNERDDLRWWPEEETNQSATSKMLYKYSEVVKNCWVTLERIEVDEEEEEDLINLPNEDLHQSRSNEEVSLVEIVPRPESNNEQQVEVIPNPQPCNQQQNNPAIGFLLLGAQGQTFFLPTLLGAESNIIYYIPTVETVPQPPITQFYTTGGFSFLSAPCQPPALGTFVAPMNVGVPPPPPPPPVAAPSFGRQIAPALPKTPPMDITPENNEKEIVPYKTLRSASFKNLKERNECTKNEKKQVFVTKKLEMFACIFCSKSYLKIDQLKSHVYNKHKNIEFECPHCTAFFKSQENLVLHFQKEHEAFEKRKIYQCTKCDQKFVENNSLKWHIANVHGKKTLQCEKCSRMFSIKKSLQQHIITHLPVGKCSSCSSEFYSISALKQHQNSRVCRRCFQLFSCWNIFKEHRHKCKFMCHICPQGREFRAEANLRHHMFLHSLQTNRKFRSKGIVNNDGAGQKKWLTCDFCGKCFVNKQSITRHFLLIHNIGESNYFCGICDKKFAAKVTLSNHVKYTHMKKLVKCKICNKSIRADILKSHYMVKHSVLPK